MDKVSLNGVEIFPFGHGYLSSDADEPAQGVRLRVGAVFSAGLYRDAGRGESGRLSGPGILR